MAPFQQEYGLAFSSMLAVQLDNVATVMNGIPGANYALRLDGGVGGSSADRYDIGNFVNNGNSNMPASIRVGYPLSQPVLFRSLPILQTMPANTPTFSPVTPAIVTPLEEIGIVNIPVTATSSVTVTQEQAFNGTVVRTGAPGVAFNVFLPNVPGLSRKIINETSGGFTATVGVGNGTGGFL